MLLKGNRDTYDLNPRMADNSPSDDAGGFVRTLPSPAPSSTNRSLAGLPKPRSRPIRPGSAKEEQVRSFVSERLLHISRRYVKKSSLPEPGDEVVGYPNFVSFDNPNIARLVEHLHLLTRIPGGIDSGLGKYYQYSLADRNTYVIPRNRARLLLQFCIY